MSKISFVYFDVGGVAIKDFSDSDKWDLMLKEMGLDKFSREKVDQIYDGHEDEVATGHRHVDSLIPLYEQEFGINLGVAFSMQKYFISHFEKNLGIWPIISELKSKLKIGLLTDMYPGMLTGIFEASLVSDTFWDQIVDSSVVGVRKPMPEIYKIAAKQAGVPAEEILFIDNRQKNIDGARRAGWQGFFYDSSNYDQANLDLTKFLSL